jgi:hypothetical protein
VISAVVTTVVAVGMLLVGGPPTPPPLVAPVPTTSAGPAATDGAIVGQFSNARGSVLSLQPGPGGTLTGTFRSAVGNVEAARRFPVVGVVNGDVVGFVVDFGAAGSVGSWSGQLRGDELVCLWHLSRDVTDADEAMGLWSSVLTGSDAFVRCPACAP